VESTRKKPGRKVDTQKKNFRTYVRPGFEKTRLPGLAKRRRESGQEEE